MKTIAWLAGSLTVATLLSSNVVLAEERSNGRGYEGAPVIYVESQGLYYDSIALADLPMQGRFQKLKPGRYGLSTDYGPGDPGHLGGRWWIDLNQNEIMDEEDKFFLCPLLGPGRETM